MAVDPSQLKQRRYEQQTAGIEAGIVGAHERIQDRWWKKEFEEFKEVAQAEYNTSMQALGSMVGDETFDDVEGAWNTYSSAIKNLMDKAGEYPDNPYIGAFSKQWFDHVQNTGSQLTGAVKSREDLAGAGQRREFEAELQPGRLAQQEAQLDLTRSQADKARGQGVLDPSKRGFSYGDPKVLINTPDEIMPQTLFAPSNKDWQRAVSNVRENKARTEWGKLGPQDKMMQSFSDYSKGVSLTDEEMKALKTQALATTFVEKGASPFAAQSMAISLMGAKKPPIDEAARTVGPVPSNTMVPAKTAPMYRQLFGTTEDLGEDPIEDLGGATSLNDLEKKYKGSTIANISQGYRQQRARGRDHVEAVEQVSREIFDDEVGKYYNLTDISGTTDRNIQEFRSELIRFLQVLGDMFVAKDVESGISDIQKQLYEEGGGILSATGAKLVGAQILAPFQKLEGPTNMLDQEYLSSLSKEGVRSGGTVLPQRKRFLGGLSEEEYERRQPILGP